MKVSLLDLVVVSLVANPLAASDLELTWEGGLLGGDLTFSAEGDTGQDFLVIPALDPLRFPVFCGTGQVCTLNIDLSMLNTWKAGTVGLVDVLYTVPPQPSLVGLTLHGQAFTFPGPFDIVDEVSNDVQFVLGAEGETHHAVGLMNETRRWASLTTLLDGQVLVAGGEAPGAPPSPLDTYELFDPQTQTFGEGSVTLPEARSRHTATLLQDGRVLLLGGVGAGGAVLDSGVIYEPSTDTFSSTADMSDPRVLHTATLLADGTVLVAGGSRGYDALHVIGYPDSLTGPLNTTSETYDPVSDTWTAGPSFPLGLTAHTATLVDNDVVIVGGVSATLPERSVTAACTLYDPSANSFTPFTAPLPEAKAFHGAVLVEDGPLFVSGGAAIDFATESFGQTATSHYISTNDTAWTEGGGGAEVAIIIKQCIPRLNDDPNKYLPGNGLSDVDLPGGTGTVQESFLSTEDPDTAFASLGSISGARVGSAFAAIDDGRRLLVIGAIDATDKTADVFLLP